ncbi:signal peptidase II [Candidatus Woesearchaeota archaeon]|nr:signal peptidase II [Candidatus Woesearchaeota archaeon]
MKKFKYKWIIFIIISIIILLTDRLTKIWALNLTKTIDFKFFAFTLVKNTGAGFGLFQDLNSVLIYFSVIVLGLLIYFYDRINPYSFTFIAAGLTGNIIDRIFYGFVIDFINFKIWPVFNIADSFITIGVILLIIEFFRKKD